MNVREREREMNIYDIVVGSQGRKHSKNDSECDIIRHGTMHMCVNVFERSQDCMTNALNSSNKLEGLALLSAASSTNFGLGLTGL